jgi:hypothetical protein
MDMLRLTNTELIKNYRFRSFFTAITRCYRNTKPANKSKCSFFVTRRTEPIGHFEFEYSIDIDGRVTLLRMQVSRFDKGKCRKVATYNFATYLLSIYRFKKICQVKLDLKAFKKLIDWFCNEYELNAEQKTYLSLFAYRY